MKPNLLLPLAILLIGCTETFVRVYPKPVWEMRKECVEWKNLSGSGVVCNTPVCTIHFKECVREEMKKVNTAGSYLMRAEEFAFRYQNDPEFKKSIESYEFQ